MTVSSVPPRVEAKTQTQRDRKRRRDWTGRRLKVGPWSRSAEAWCILPPCCSPTSPTPKRPQTDTPPS
eukprot:1043164-Rhodomonas_salina.1